MSLSYLRTVSSIMVSFTEILGVFSSSACVTCDFSVISFYPYANFNTLKLLHLALPSFTLIFLMYRFLINVDHHQHQAPNLCTLKKEKNSYPKQKKSWQPRMQYSNNTKFSFPAKNPEQAPVPSVDLAR